MQKTILIANAGRRCELMERFRKSATNQGIKLKIIATEISELSPAIYMADQYYLVNKLRDAALLETYIQICRREKVDIIVPVIDPDLEFFAKYASDIEDSTSTHVVSCSHNVVTIANDKIKTAEFLQRIGIRAPKELVNPGDLHGTEFPVFAKPVNGSGSVGAAKINSIDALNAHKKQYPDFQFAVQEYIDGEEYTFDCYVAQQIYISPRIRIKTRAGESVVSQIRLDPELISEAKQILSQPGFSGPITLQAIKPTSGGRPCFIEINPRLGGGVILSIEAGLDIPAMILRNDQNHPEPKIKDGLLMIRYDQSVFIDKQNHVH